ncbi:MAG: hypothetical protein NTV22_18265 [bacterium]|nr:hypothetical protein [bacterium]
MPCFMVVIVLLAPRFFILVLWLFTGWFRGMFNSAFWPVLGFIFMPTTLFWYAAVHNWCGGQWALPQILGLIIAVMIDLSPASARRR